MGGHAQLPDPGSSGSWGSGVDGVPELAPRVLKLVSHMEVRLPGSLNPEPVGLMRGLTLSQANHSF